MDFVQAKAQIETTLKTLNEAKSYSGFGPNDAAVLELERIMLARTAELEAAKSESSGGEPLATPSPTSPGEQTDAPASTPTIWVIFILSHSAPEAFPNLQNPLQRRARIIDSGSAPTHLFWILPAYSSP
jgi:hypothetical protein